MNGIKIDEEFFKQTEIPKFDDADVEEAVRDEPLIEHISENQELVNEMLVAKQHTVMWNEEKYLDIAPGMNRTPISLLFDEYTEELAFPSIYLGEPRRFKINNVTPFMMATSEIRRKDRRGVKPEHILFMAMKIMRMRLTEGLYITFKACGDIAKLTRADVEDPKFIEGCIERNLSFMKSIPNSVQYWMARKRDVFAMIRQLGKPTVFLTMSASEYNWSDLLRILYRLEFGKEWTGKGDPVNEMNSDLRTTLVNEDPVTCCLYFDKLIDTIMWLLKSSKFTPFGKYRVIDYFKRIEFQQRGSPHAHILLLLENDPKEDIGEDMPNTIQLIDSLCCIDPEKIERDKVQTHKHTFTCYKRAKDEQNKRCRFGAPFWPMQKTVVLIPMPLSDTRRDKLQEKYKDMHRSLEFEEFNTLDEFLKHHGISSYEHYLNVIRAGIVRPRIFLQRTIQQKMMNNFNPWIAKVLKSNMDIQFILEEYSCATYVVEYVNKTNRGISNLQRELIKMRDDYPDKDYSELISSVGIKMLNSVEISSQEAAWYLLNLHMSEARRKIDYIPTTWPHERQKVRKTRKQMDEEGLEEISLNIWKQCCIEKYESRPSDLSQISLAQFVANYYKTNKGEYKNRQIRKVIRYRNYELAELDEYKREMVLLHIPFTSKEVEILDQNKYRQIYDEKEQEILEARKEFESRIDIDRILEECKKLFPEEMDKDKEDNAKIEGFIKTKATTDDFVNTVRDGIDDDIKLKVMEKMSSIVRKRKNVMTAEEYCKKMRLTNERQRDLIPKAIHRMYTTDRKPLQIFLTGPAGCGKTFTMKLMMETYNRFAQNHNNAFNAYVATASTGMAAASINGATVHSAFRISNSKHETGLSVEALNSFRTTFNNVKIIFVDECSMIGSGMLTQINSRIQKILHDHDTPFGGMNMVFCGDLRQLPPVCQTPIFKRSRQNFCCEIVWQKLEYYPLTQVMRQANVTFATILTKIGNGESLLPDERKLIESRFVTQEYVNEKFPEVIRLFFNTADVNEFNKMSINGQGVITYVAQDEYIGTKNNEQLKHARDKVYKMKPDETGGLPYMLQLSVDKPYMIRANIDVIDGLVNGAIGTLRYIERDLDESVKKLWFSFNDKRIGRSVKAKCQSNVLVLRA